MRVRIYTTGGDRIDAEQFSPDNGVTWVDIQVGQVVAAMGAQTGYTVVRDVLTTQWRAFRNVSIESIGPAGDIEQVIEAEVERRIREALADRLPAAVLAAVTPPPAVPPPVVPPAVVPPPAVSPGTPPPPPAVK
jgi:hypothetical protein